jgi:hypothetical protein
MLPLQAVDAGLLEPTLPQRHRRGAGTEFPLDFAITQTIGQGENQTRTRHIASRQCPRLRPSLQFLALFFGNLQQVSIISHII